MSLSDSKKKEAKEAFNLYDDDCEQKIDGADIGSCVRALGLKPTNAMVWKAAGAEYKRGDKKITLEEFLPIYEALTKEKEQGTFADFMEGLRVFDKDETGKILAAELRHILLALGERLSHEDVDEIMQGVEDGEGMVDYQAFIKKVLAGPFPEEDK